MLMSPNENIGIRQPSCPWLPLPAFVLLCACVRYWPYCGDVSVCFSAGIGTNYMGQSGPIRHLAPFAEVAAVKLL